MGDNSSNIGIRNVIPLDGNEVGNFTTPLVRRLLLITFYLLSMTLGIWGGIEYGKSLKQTIKIPLSNGRIMEIGR